jgi:hypothetical protein
MYQTFGRHHMLHYANESLSLNFFSLSLLWQARGEGLKLVKSFLGENNFVTYEGFA